MLSFLLSSNAYGLRKQFESLDSYHKHYLLVCALVINSGMREDGFNILRQELSGMSANDLKSLYSSISDMYQNAKKHHNRTMSQLSSLAASHSGALAAAMQDSLPQGVSFEAMNLHTELCNLSMKFIACTLGANIKPSTITHVHKVYESININHDDFIKAYNAVRCVIPSEVNFSAKDGYDMLQEIIKINKEKWIS